MLTFYIIMKFITSAIKIDEYLTYINLVEIIEKWFIEVSDAEKCIFVNNSINYVLVSKSIL